MAARDRLLAAVSLRDVGASEKAATSLLAEPLEDWQYRTDDVAALRIWSRDAMSTSVLQQWLESENGTLSTTGLALVGREQLNQMFAVDRLIDRFNEQMIPHAVAPKDGLDAIAGSVTSWPILAMNMVLDSTKR